MGDKRPLVPATSTCSTNGDAMLMTTTNTIQGRDVAEYKGIVTGEAIMGANILRDLFAI